MIQQLLQIYHESITPGTRPECAFNETEIFSEGWLLRATLFEWRRRGEFTGFGFLPFPADARFYSEGQLSTPFKARQRGDAQAEAYTHVDGIVGHFAFEPGTHAGIRLSCGARYIAVFEAKMYSGLSADTKNAAGYDQLSRNAACLINAIIRANVQGCAAHLVVLYPQDNSKIVPGRHTPSTIRDVIRQRIAQYGTIDEHFAACWPGVLSDLQVAFVTWEDVLAQVQSDELDEFYALCKQFNRSDRSQ